MQESKQGLESEIVTLKTSMASLESEHANLQSTYASLLASKATDQKALFEECQLLTRQKKQLEEESHQHQKQSLQ